MTFLIRPFIDELSKDKVLPIFQGFVVTDSNLLFTNILVVGVAALIGAIGSPWRSAASSTSRQLVDARRTTRPSPPRWPTGSSRSPSTARTG